MFAFWLFQWIIGLSGGIVLVVSLLFAIVKDQVSSEEQMADISLFAWHGCHGVAQHLLIILWSHNTQSKRCITDYILVRQQLYTQLTRPFPPHVEVGWLTRLGTNVRPVKRCFWKFPASWKSPLLH